MRAKTHAKIATHANAAANAPRNLPSFRAIRGVSARLQYYNLPVLTFSDRGKPLAGNRRKRGDVTME